MREALSQAYQEQAEHFFDSQADSYAIMQLDHPAENAGGGCP